MPNQSAFEVRISRTAVERLLKECKAKYMFIEGSYKYKGKKNGIHIWSMTANAKMQDNEKLRVEPCCPMPCRDDSDDSEQ
jgi:hypothetical protein